MRPWTFFYFFNLYFLFVFFTCRFSSVFLYTSLLDMFFHRFIFASLLDAFFPSIYFILVRCRFSFNIFCFLDGRIFAAILFPRSSSFFSCSFYVSQTLEGWNRSEKWRNWKCAQWTNQAKLSDGNKWSDYKNNNNFILGLKSWETKIIVYLSLTWHIYSSELVLFTTKKIVFTWSWI